MGAGSPAQNQDLKLPKLLGVSEALGLGQEAQDTRKGFRLERAPHPVGRGVRIPWPLLSLPTASLCPLRSPLAVAGLPGFFGGECLF